MLVSDSEAGRYMNCATMMMTPGLDFHECKEMASERQYAGNAFNYRWTDGSCNVVLCIYNNWNLMPAATFTFRQYSVYQKHIKQAERWEVDNRGDVTPTPNVKSEETIPSCPADGVWKESRPNNEQTYIAKCPDGLKGSMTRVCTADGKWSEVNMDDCERYVECTEPPDERYIAFLIDTSDSVTTEDFGEVMLLLKRILMATHESVKFSFVTYGSDVDFGVTWWGNTNLHKRNC
eukprot:TRINITY_DN3713_c0_g1_i1.p1 TRINITY_DN3713_c0_g1~~TRINITY_DN3713_c0_g1_i1.p1  ORF type:complete len:234 (+),score=19.01 TRINITY_DN3713_c0_g1_i1:99-800(+)